jgi:GH15 family glucan-1,4-alpha-glucosidase
MARSWAWNQRQLDVYGELLSAARRLRDQATRDFLVEVADTAAERWEDADQGIWEVRGEPRHFLYPKLMCWVALDCAIELAGPLGAAERVAGWDQTRGRVREAIKARARQRGVGDLTGRAGERDSPIGLKHEAPFIHWISACRSEGGSTLGRS